MFLFLKKKKKKPPEGKVQALFWKLRIVEILPNRKSIFKTDFPVCIPLRDSVLWLPSGPCHSSCHYLDNVPCYTLCWAWRVVWQREIFLPLSRYYRWMGGRGRLICFFNYVSVGLENMSFHKQCFLHQSDQLFSLGKTFTWVKKSRVDSERVCRKHICFLF